ncbi:MAG: DUF4111 domain-containing protein [Oscillospiraceae bacterium]|jgi:hypothetical protein|nr:DUF4111 domain-containing protein [Oscillospiraceae bacterium]
MSTMTDAVHTMTNEIVAILADCTPTIYLYGSAATDDSRLGWSDIDLLVLTRGDISAAQADALLPLRQIMMAREPDNPYYRSFEGGMLDLAAFLSGERTRAVYWGTSGQRIAERHALNNLSMAELLTHGRLLRGEEVRGRMAMPTYAQLCADVGRHVETIRKYAQTTGRSIYSYGWLLDIARGLYTLQTGQIIAKTVAGEWALAQGLCPNAEVMQMALAVRKNPMRYKDDPNILDKAAALGGEIQRFADVLGRGLSAGA